MKNAENTSLIRIAALFAAALQLPGLCLGGSMENMRAASSAFSLPALTKPVPYALPGKPAVRPGALLPPEVAAKLPELGIKLDDWDLWRIEEIYNLWRQAGQTLWPGVTGVETTPILLVFPWKNDVLIGHPHPPADCLPFSSDLGADRFCYRKNVATHYSGEMKALNGVPTVMVFTLATLDERGAQQMNTPAYRHPYLSNSATYAHELFHAFQAREKTYLAQDPDATGVSKVDYPSGDPELNMLLGVEARVLADALYASGPALDELMRDFMAVRAERYSRLMPKARRAAGFFELIEGTAQYISYSISSGVQPGLKPLPETLFDPRFTGYNAQDSLGESISSTLKIIHRSQKVSSCAFAYHSGAAIAFALDKLDPGWKADLFRTVSGRGRSLDSLVAGLVKPDNSPERLARVKARYNAAALLAETEAELGAQLAENKKNIAAFKAMPGRRVRLVFPDTPADDVGLVAPAALAEYGAERLYLQGFYGVQYGKRDELKAAISTPVLLDMISGTVELVLPGSAPAWPEIKAGRVYQSGIWTVYEEGVSVGGEIFGWSGERLEVSEKDGVLTLGFYRKL